MTILMVCTNYQQNVRCKHQWSVAIHFKIIMFIPTSLLWIALTYTLKDVSANSTYYQQEAEYFTALIGLYTINNRSMVDFVPKVSNTGVEVSVSTGLLALQDLNEVDGTLELMIYLEMYWRDSIVLASGLNMTDVFPNTSVVSNIFVPHDSIWTPKLVLVNSVDSLDAIGNVAYRPRFHLESGLVTWKPRVKVRSACSPDVTYYPFDTQTCTFSLTAWGQYSNEIQLGVKTEEWDMSFYEENGEWKILSTKSSLVYRNEAPYLVLSITIARQPLYHALYIIFPILVLIVLNGMVFWLPVESGERVGFSVTCFLSFVVLLNMIMDILPRSSSPMSLLCYYTVCMMMFSGLTTTIVILEMRLFHRPEKEPVPKTLQKFVRFFQCKSCKRRKPNNDITPITAITIGNPQEGDKKTKHGEPMLVKAARPDVVKNVKEEDKDTEDEEVTWAELTQFFDKFLFLVFVGGQTLLTVLFLIPLVANAQI